MKTRFEIGAVLATAFVLVALGLVATQIVVIRQNRQLKQQLNAAIARANRSMEAPVGTTLRPLHGIDLDGNTKTIEYGRDRRRTLLLVFTPTCPWCAKNWPNWAAIVKSVDPAGVRIVAVDLSSTVTKEFALEHELPVESVLYRPEPKDVRDYKLTLTPQTLLIDRNGVVEKVWTGLFDSEQQPEITSALSLSTVLPAVYRR